MLSFTIGANSITVFVDGEINTIDSSHINHSPLLEELRKPPEVRDMVAIKSLVSIMAMIDKFVHGKIRMTDAAVLFEDNPVGDLLAQRMLEIFQQGIDVTPYAMFMENVRQNPASYVHQELYEWMEKGKLPITPDGHLIAFKKVNANYTDCHTGKFDNSVGAILEMSRDACDPNRHQHCSTGFHFCSPDYLSQFCGDHVMIVKINPRDVTSIPSDYKFTKGRTCRYEVIGELTGQSVSRHKVWAKPVLDFDDPAEFPADVVKALLGHIPLKTQVVPAEDGEPDVEVEDDIDLVDDSDCSDLESDEEPAVVPEQPVEAGPVIERVGDTLVVKVIAPAAPVAAPDDLEFTTKDSRLFTATILLKAIAEHGSTRGAAKALGVGESSLRGWIKQINGA